VRTFSGCGSFSAAFFISGIANSSSQFSRQSFPPAAARCGHFGVRQLAAAFPSSNPHRNKAGAAPAHRKKSSSASIVL